MAVLVTAIVILGHYYYRARPYVEVDGHFTVITTDPVPVENDSIDFPQPDLPGV